MRGAGGEAQAGLVDLAVTLLVVVAVLMANYQRVMEGLNWVRTG